LFCIPVDLTIHIVLTAAEVDVLISLSQASINSAPTCRPVFVTDSVKIASRGGRHPLACLTLAGGGNFVPNDIALGGEVPPFMLLTGPNMGGKSTLIRQVCLAVVAAQVCCLLMLNIKVFL
jgi:DNA mismatch repair protein MSH6